MFSESSDNQSLGPLSVGNIISAALRLYRDNFKSYFGLALKAVAWIFIPFYGWAKYAALVATIARLAYAEVRERPESVLDAVRAVDPRKWTLLWAGILILLMGAGLTIGLGIISVIIIASLMSTPSLYGLGLIAGLIFFLIWLYFIIWIGSRYSVSEMPIAIEGERSSTTSLARSWALTKGFVWRIQLIFFMASLVSLPISIAIEIADSILKAIFHTSSTSSLYETLNLVISLIANALIVPFWSCIKALLYYDLRTRKEGIDLLNK